MSAGQRGLPGEVIGKYTKSTSMSRKRESIYSDRRFSIVMAESCIKNPLQQEYVLVPHRLAWISIKVSFLF